MPFQFCTANLGGGLGTRLGQHLFVYMCKPCTDLNCLLQQFWFSITPTKYPSGFWYGVRVLVSEHMIICYCVRVLVAEHMIICYCVRVLVAEHMIICYCVGVLVAEHVIYSWHAGYRWLFTRRSFERWNAPGKRTPSWCKRGHHNTSARWRARSRLSKLRKRDWDQSWGSDGLLI